MRSLNSINTEAAIGAVAAPLTGLPACIAGSSVAALVYDKPLGENADIDVFCYTEETLIAALTILRAHPNFTLNERFERVYFRWLKYGLRNWHTNSIKFDHTHGFQVNLVYKLTGGHPNNSLSGVIESFDFGLLGAGFDLSLDTQLRDLRPFLFPGYDLDGPLPLMPNKQEAWKNGFISQYNGLREAGRYAKYYLYGYDMSLIQPVLVDGYELAVRYLRDRGDEDKSKLADIYEAIASKILLNEAEELVEANALILTLDSLDMILDALE